MGYFCKNYTYDEAVIIFRAVVTAGLFECPGR
jgi:hypothetical protein